MAMFTSRAMGGTRHPRYRRSNRRIGFFVRRDVLDVVTLLQSSANATEPMITKKPTTKRIRTITGGCLLGLVVFLPLLAACGDDTGSISYNDASSTSTQSQAHTEPTRFNTPVSVQIEPDRVTPQPRPATQSTQPHPASQPHEASKGPATVVSDPRTINTPTPFILPGEYLTANAIKAKDSAGGGPVFTVGIIRLPPEPTPTSTPPRSIRLEGHEVTLSFLAPNWGRDLGPYGELPMRIIGNSELCANGVTFFTHAYFSWSKITPSGPFTGSFGSGSTSDYRVTTDYFSPHISLAANQCEQDYRLVFPLPTDVVYQIMFYPNRAQPELAYTLHIWGGGTIGIR